MIVRCEECHGMNVVFLRMEPVFEDDVGIEPKMLREIHECRDCGYEFSIEKKL